MCVVACGGAHRYCRLVHPEHQFTGKVWMFIPGRFLPGHQNRARRFRNKLQGVKHLPHDASAKSLRAALVDSSEPNQSRWQRRHAGSSLERRSKSGLGTLTHSEVWLAGSPSAAHGHARPRSAYACGLSAHSSTMSAWPFASAAAASEPSATSAGSCPRRGAATTVIASWGTGLCPARRGIRSGWASGRSAAREVWRRRR
jgi:hypothetical protein